MGYYEQYRAILDELKEPPENEEQTKLWIIQPTLLQTLGYAAVDLVPEQANVTGQRPDYAVLPSSGFPWLLEAKSWTVELTVQHAMQATTYAYQNQLRWVVLTNGREWHLYDSRRSTFDDRLVLRATKDEPEAMEALLSALSKAQVLGEGIETAVRVHRLRGHLHSALQQDGAVTKAIRNAVQRVSGLEGVTIPEVLSVLKAIMRPLEYPAIPTAAETTVAESPSASAPRTEEGWYAINDAALNPTARKPTAARFGNDTVSVSSWIELWHEGVEWLAKHAPKPLPIPWRAGPRTKRRIWINTELKMADGASMRAPRQVEVSSGVVYLEVHGSASHLVSLLRRLCSDVGFDAGEIRVRIE